MGRNRNQEARNVDSPDPEEMPTDPTPSLAAPDPKEIGKNDKGGPEFEKENKHATVQISEEDAPANDGGTYSEEDQLRSESWAKLSGRKQLVIYNGPQTFTMHYNPNVRYTLTKGNNVLPIEIWEMAAARSNVKRAIKRGIMIDKGECDKKATVKGKYRDGNIIPDDDDEAVKDET